MEEGEGQKELKRAAQKLYRSARKALDIPGQFSELLQTAIRGQGKINLEVTGSEKPLRTISAMVRQLALSLLCGAIFIGSALLTTVESFPRWGGFPWPAAVGFLIALAMLVYLVGSWLRRKK